ncbi:MAG: enoyl-CoA hydratase/isomerase family protein [Candidatus Methylomirabilis sp.]|nr:enoyl-CoA hydratase/isomerase family protein [Deltaproteobacteria bacterium]
MAVIEKPSERVRVIRLNDPETLNSLSFELAGDLYAAIAEVGADNACSVAVLTGAGRGFCSGMNLEYVGMPPGCEGLPVSRIAIRAMSFMSGLVPALRAIPQPVIAAVNGAAYGGGMCLSLGADIRIASENAVFCGAGILNGIAGTEMGVSFLLPRAVGLTRSNEIVLTGRKVEAAEAERIGLVSRVTAEEELMPEALRIAERIAAHSTYGVSMTKKVLWSALECGSLEAAIDLEDRNQLLVRMTTRNFEEALRARKQKRPPAFED